MQRRSAVAGRKSMPDFEFSSKLRLELRDKGPAARNPRGLEALEDVFRLVALKRRAIKRNPVFGHCSRAVVWIGIFRGWMAGTNVVERIALPPRIKKGPIPFRGSGQ